MTTGQGQEPADTAPSQDWSWGVKEVVLVLVAAVIFTPTFFFAGVVANGIITGIRDLSCVNCMFAGAGIIIIAPGSVIVSLILAFFAWLPLTTGNVPRRFVFPVWFVIFASVAAALTVAGEDSSEAYVENELWCIVALGFAAYLVLNVAAHDGGARRAIQRLKVRISVRASELLIALGVYAVALAGSALYANFARSYRQEQGREVGWLETEWMVIERHPLLIINDISWWSALSIPVAVILVPIGSALIFRAFAFQGLVAKLRVTGAAILTAAIFAIPNASLTSWLTLLIFIPEPNEPLGILPIAFIMGLAFTIIYYRTQSLIFVVALHALNNAVGITLALQGNRDLVFPVM